jgi:hypothetical protein
MRSRAPQNDLDAARMLQQQTTRHLQIECDRLREELRVSEIQRTNAVAQLQVFFLGSFSLSNYISVHMFL